MAKIEITIDDAQIEVLSERGGLATLLQPVITQILDAEMTEQAVRPNASARAVARAPEAVTITATVP